MTHFSILSTGLRSEKENSLAYLARHAPYNSKIKEEKKNAASFWPKPKGKRKENWLDRFTVSKPQGNQIQSDGCSKRQQTGHRARGTG